MSNTVRMECRVPILMMKDLNELAKRSDIKQVYDSKTAIVKAALEDKLNDLRYGKTKLKPKAARR